MLQTPIPFNKEQLAVKQTPIIQTFNWSGF